jgi:hypothetical protein
VAGTTLPPRKLKPRSSPPTATSETASSQADASRPVRAEGEEANAPTTEPDDERAKGSEGCRATSRGGTRLTYLRTKSIRCAHSSNCVRAARRKADERALRRC